MSKIKQRTIKPSELLKEAKKYLSYTHSSENDSYVCFCVSIAVDEILGYTNNYNKSCQEASDYLHRYITGLLQGWRSLAGWLSYQDIPDFPDSTTLYEHLVCQRKLQETRHAWVDWMIKDLESQGL